MKHEAKPGEGWDVASPQPPRPILERTETAQRGFEAVIDGDPQALAFERSVRPKEPTVFDVIDDAMLRAGVDPAQRGYATDILEEERLLDPWVGDPRTGEVRVVDAETGGMKGSKPARFDMIPADVLWELAEHYGKGEAKYPGEPTGQANWQKGYPWHLSVAALQRHLFAWLAGEDADPETGSNHLVAVIWHAIALRFFQRHGLGTDDIWTRRLGAA